MNTESSKNKDLYFTNDHEWIDFRGTVAYVGVCSFKLSGFKTIHKISFDPRLGSKRRGEVIATVRYNENLITVRMPVDGKVIEINDELLSGNQDVLVQYPLSRGWIALIVPDQPFERKNLVQSSQYRMKTKNYYAK